VTEKIQFDYRKLRGRIVEKFGTVSAFCEALGRNRSALTMKLNDGAGMKQEEIISIANALDIEDEMYRDYFFTPAVKKTEPENLEN